MVRLSLSQAALAATGRTVLVTRAPPLYATWIWHVHRLKPRAYKHACAALGAFAAPAPSAGFAASDSADAVPATGVDARGTEDELVGAAVRHAQFL